MDPYQAVAEFRDGNDTDDEFEVDAQCRKSSGRTWTREHSDNRYPIGKRPRGNGGNKVKKLSLPLHPPSEDDSDVGSSDSSAGRSREKKRWWEAFPSPRSLRKSSRDSSKDGMSRKSSSLSTSPRDNQSSDEKTTAVFRTISSPRGKKVTRKASHSDRLHIEQKVEKPSGPFESVSIPKSSSDLKLFNDVVFDSKMSGYRALNPEDVEKEYQKHIDEILIKFVNNLSKGKDFMVSDLRIVQEKVSWNIVSSFKNHDCLAHIFQGRLKNCVSSLQIKLNNDDSQNTKEKIQGFIDFLESINVCFNENRRGLDALMKKYHGTPYPYYFLSLFNDDIEIAKEVLDVVLEWTGSRAIIKVSDMIDTNVKLFLFTKRDFSWDIKKEDVRKIKETNLEQVARSFVVNDSRIIYECVEVNGRKVEVDEWTGKALEDQRTFFRQFLTLLYEEGLYVRGFFDGNPYNKTFDGFVEKQLDILMETVEALIKGDVAVSELAERRKKVGEEFCEFVGKEILCLVSMAGWAQSNTMIRAQYKDFCFGPDSKYKMKQEGFRCRVFVQNGDGKKKFTTILGRTCHIYEAMSPGAVVGLAVQDKPLCSFDVDWVTSTLSGIPSDAEKFEESWSSTLRFSKVERGSANKEQWDECLTYITTPHPVETIPIEYPEDPELQSAYDLLMI